jgi:hypothetical protein
VTPPSHVVRRDRPGPRTCAARPVPARIPRRVRHP